MLREERSILEHTIRGLREEVRECTEEVDRMQATQDNLYSDVGIMKQEKQELEGERDRVRQERDELTAEVQMLREQLGRVQEVLHLQEVRPGVRHKILEGKTKTKPEEDMKLKLEMQILKEQLCRIEGRVDTQEEKMEINNPEPVEMGRRTRERKESWGQKACKVQRAPRVRQAWGHATHSLEAHRSASQGNTRPSIREEQLHTVDRNNDVIEDGMSPSQARAIVARMLPKTGTKMIRQEGSPKPSRVGYIGTTLQVSQLQERLRQAEAQAQRLGHVAAQRPARPRCVGMGRSPPRSPGTPDKSKPVNQSAVQKVSALRAARERVHKQLSSN